jgi:hypothetical protein
MKGNGLCHFENKSNLIPSEKLHGWFFDIGIFDIFQNGNQDIWISADYGLNHLLKFKSVQEGWEDKSFLLNKEGVSRNGMGIIFSDINHDKNPTFYVPSVYQPGEKVYGNQSWIFSKQTQTMQEVAYSKNIHSCGWTWGSQFIDLNNDGWDDLALTGGMFGNGSKKSYWYSLSVLDASGREFMGNIKNWPDMKNFDLEGGQPGCIYLNQGKDNPMLEVGSMVNFNNLSRNGRGLAYIDINNNGKYSLLIANQNDDSIAFDVNSLTSFRWIGLALKSIENKNFEIGAKVRWTLSNGQENEKEMRNIQGFSAQNDPRIRLVIPENLTIQKISIRWLNDQVDNIELDNLKMNSYNQIFQKK